MIAADVSVPAVARGVVACDATTVSSDSRLIAVIIDPSGCSTVGGASCLITVVIDPSDRVAVGGRARLIPEIIGAGCGGAIGCASCFCKCTQRGHR